MNHRDRRLGSMAPWFVLGLIVLGIGYAGFSEVSAPARGEDGCLLEGSPEHWILLADNSEILPGAQLDSLGRVMRRMAAKSGPETRFSLYALGGAPGEPDLRRIFSGCLGVGALSGDRIRDRETKAFLTEPDVWFQGLAAESRPTSPIWEGVQGLLFSRDVFEAGTVHLQVISDFIEHVPGKESHYPWSADYKVPSTERAPELAVRPIRKFSSVVVGYVTRAKDRRVQTSEHLRHTLMRMTGVSETPPLLEKY